VNPAGPFPKNVLRGQIQRFEKCLVVREDAFALCDFPELAMVTLDHVGGVNDLSNFRRVFEEGREFCPVPFPRFGD